MKRQKAQAVREPQTLEQAERDLNYARHILSGSMQNRQPEEWLLLVTLVGEADLAFQEARRHDPNLEWPSLEAALQDLRKATEGLTKPEFARAIGSGVRRRYRGIFK